MKIRWSVQSLILVYFLGCSSIREVEPVGPFAGFGTI